MALDPARLEGSFSVAQRLSETRLTSADIPLVASRLALADLETSDLFVLDQMLSDINRDISVASTGSSRAAVASQVLTLHKQQDLSAASRSVAPPAAVTSAGGRPKRTDIREWALAKLEEKVGGRLKKLGAGQTFALPNGRRIHLRSMQRFDRGEGRYSYWFGLGEDKWVDGEVFVMACDRDALLIVPVEDWLPFKDLIPTAKGGTERQPSVWFVHARLELRVGGEHIDVTKWRDRFDLLDGRAPTGSTLND